MTNRSIERFLRVREDSHSILAATKYLFSGYIVVFSALSKHCSNWPKILLNYVYSKPGKVVLRAGFVLSYGSRVRPYTIESLTRLIDAGWKIVKIDKDYAVIQQNGIRLKCRLDTWVDFSSACEVFLEKAYDGQFNGKVVMDVGMSNGDAAIFFAVNGADLVVGLEPDKASYLVVKENIALNCLENKIITINAALDSQCGWANFVQSTVPTRNRLSSSSFEKWTEDDTYGVDKVRTVTLPQVMAELGLPRVNFVKMDCEGSENRILRELEASDFLRFDEFVMETHGGAEEVLAILCRNGFDVKRYNGSYVRAVRKVTVNSPCRYFCINC